MGKRKEIKKKLKVKDSNNKLPSGKDLTPSLLIIKQTIDLIMENIKPAMKDVTDEKNREFLSNLNWKIISGLDISSWDCETTDWVYRYLCNHPND